MITRLALHLKDVKFCSSGVVKAGTPVSRSWCQFYVFSFSTMTSATPEADVGAGLLGERSEEEELASGRLSSRTLLFFNCGSTTKLLN
jgi:hypothetical protein